MAKSSKPKGDAESDPAPPRPEIVQEIERYLQTIRLAAAATEPFLGKLNPDQINQIIAHSESQSQRKWAAERHGQLVLAGAVFVTLTALCFLWTISLAYERPELVADLIKMIGGLLGGLLGGYGIRGVVEHKARKPQGPPP